MYGPATLTEIFQRLQTIPLRRSCHLPKMGSELTNTLACEWLPKAYQQDKINSDSAIGNALIVCMRPKRGWEEDPMCSYQNT